MTKLTVEWLTEGVGQLIRSKKFKKIKHMLRDLECGRCYWGLYYEFLVQEGYLTWAERSHSLLQVTEKGQEVAIVGLRNKTMSLKEFIKDTNLVKVGFKLLLTPCNFFGVPGIYLGDKRYGTPTWANDYSWLSHREIHALVLEVVKREKAAEFERVPSFSNSYHTTT